MIHFGAFYVFLMLIIDIVNLGQIVHLITLIAYVNIPLPLSQSLRENSEKREREMFLSGNYIVDVWRAPRVERHSHLNFSPFKNFQRSQLNISAEHTHEKRAQIILTSKSRDFFRDILVTFFLSSWAVDIFLHSLKL